MATAMPAWILERLGVQCSVPPRRFEEDQTRRGSVQLLLMGSNCFHFATQLLGTTKYRAVQQPTALPSNSRISKHFASKWYVLVQHFLSLETGALPIELHS
jgi:hypothetical protein